MNTAIAIDLSRYTTLLNRMQPVRMEGEIVELVALTALNIFTNYFNHVADTEVDFLPKVETKKLASAA